MSNDDEHLAALTQAFIQLGAGPDAARVMAAQLWKRAQQVAQEKSVPFEDALAELLAKVAAGRRGEYQR